MIVSVSVTVVMNAALGNFIEQNMLAVGSAVNGLNTVAEPSQVSTSFCACPN